jgi:hypothetical protein
LVEPETLTAMTGGHQVAGVTKDEPLISNLYLLSFRDKGLFKVGKADDVHARGRRLRWLGEPAYSESYFITGPTKLVFRLETLLKTLLRPAEARSWVGPTAGDGYTEVFPLALFGEALGTMERYCARNPTVLLRKVRSPMDQKLDEVLASLSREWKPPCAT